MNIETANPIQDLLGAVPRQVPFAQVRASLVVLLLFSLMTGIMYPLLVTAIAQVAFPYQANGSLIRDKTGAVRGSRLLAQDFGSPEFFQARPSAVNWAAGSSGATNLAITSQAEADAVAGRRVAWSTQHPGVAAPAEMLYASGSGLDPDISRESALAQLSGIATTRGLDAAAWSQLKSLIEGLSRQVLPGEPPRVNVVDLNQALLQEPAYNPGN